MVCRGHEMSGHMAMVPGVQPSNIPWPEHSFSVAVESFVKGAKSMQKWEVHFFAPGLAVWTLPMPWVSAGCYKLRLTSISCGLAVLLSGSPACCCGMQGLHKSGMYTILPDY